MTTGSKVSLVVLAEVARMKVFAPDNPDHDFIVAEEVAYSPPFAISLLFSLLNLSVPLNHVVFSEGLLRMCKLMRTFARIIDKTTALWAN